MDEKNQQLINSNIIDAKIPTRYIGLTFDDFIAETDKQKVILEACKGFTKKEFDVGLIMCGRNGTGKSMLCSIIIQEIIRMNPYDNHGGNPFSHFKQAKRLYTEAIKLVRLVKSSWRKDSRFTEQEVLDYFTSPTVLVVDEIGVQYGSATEAQFITEIINDRYNQRKPTILCGNMTIAEIKNLIGERVVDRFRDGGRVLVYDWESYRGRK